ncbi:NAD(P)-dependent oxidoreductase [Maritalea porphyrae]|uniref:precorrin-2 dehydrogenase n=1 Tax=Maritalea porphyrae TaxID=880732 RepID=A0ABQ5UTD3_9HYPH|nr:NAD(P)-dependent oxidoreductase [Maritalea porphyrae]GLQ17227.1 siroheme synthase [Maritalea porphyrae]
MNAPFLRQSSRPVTQTRKKRIDELSVLPVFFNLTGKQVLIIGGTDAAAWKAELLAAAGAKVFVHAASYSDDFKALIKSSADRFYIRRQHQLATDIAEASMVICDAPNAHAAKQVRSIAKLYGVPVNIIDQPEHCDFQFGSIVNRSPAVIAISTSSAAPIFGQAIRRRIEMVLPAKLSAWAALAQQFREKANAMLAPGHERRSFWERFVDKAFREEVKPSSTEELIEAAKNIKSGASRPSILTHIGYRVDDPEMVTIKAMRALQSADVIVHSSTTPDAILELARREAKRVCVDDPNIANAPAGKHVVKLIEGNPCLFDQLEASPKTTSCVPETA